MMAVDLVFCLSVRVVGRRGLDQPRGRVLIYVGGRGSKMDEEVILQIGIEKSSSNGWRVIGMKSERRGINIGRYMALY